jgi:hypothetical protein
VESPVCIGLVLCTAGLLRGVDLLGRALAHISAALAQSVPAAGPMALCGGGCDGVLGVALGVAPGQAGVCGCRGVGLYDGVG